MSGKNPGAGLLAVAVFLAAAFWSLALSGGLPNPNEAHPQQAQHETQPKPAEPSGDDRLADYTWWLTAFTGLLAAVSGVQGWLLIRADRAATVAANRNRETTARSMELREKQFAVASAANKINATGQRAWIKIESVKLVWPTTIPNLEGVPNPDDEAARITRLVIKVALENIGHSPSSQLNVSCQVSEPGIELRQYVPDHEQYIRHVRSEGGSVILPDDRENRFFEFWGALPRGCFQDLPNPCIVLALRVRATYRISTDTDIHTTHFAYRQAVACRSLGDNDEIVLTRDGDGDQSPT